MLDRGELDRLGKIYGDLRDRLLDLTKKNRTLNYTISPRSKRQLQIVDEVLEEVYPRLVGNGDSLRVAHLEEPDTTPPEEKTEEFIDALEHAKVSDMEYLTALEALVSSGNDDDVAVERLERNLRDRVRQQLDLPHRPKRAEVNRNDHARSLGIDPSPELPAVGTKKSHSDRLLQTLKYPDELEAVMAKIADEARLAEQEAGISTLFLAFGFLEWYESDTSDKAYYAPLLLLPVRVDREKVRGKIVYEIAAREEAAETNVSLQRFLETKFGRTLPEFEGGDSEDDGSVEDYFALVQDSIEGLKRWRVRRWLVLGHFAFSRIAIYEDTKPERWGNHPASYPLVKALLSGFEQSSGDSGPAFRAPEDYRIDDPDVERLAPILIQDADASQHSALVDVMKSKNLVIQGPPGTGKSQTITNIIANALAVDRTVLFLAEKQAALDVVKRRMDKAGLGDFCLELHSDRSSPRAVIQSLAQRYELGVGYRPRGASAREDVTWMSARARIGEYLEALHAEAEDGATPFGLIWESIRGRTDNADLGNRLAGVEIRSDLLNEPHRLDEVKGRLEIFATDSQSFMQAYCHPSLSPWAVTPPGPLPAYDHERLVQALERLHAATADLVAFMSNQGALGISSPENSDIGAAENEKTAIVDADNTLGDPPDSSIIASISDLDLDGLEHALSLQEACLAAATAVDALPWPKDADATKLDFIPELVSALPDQTLAWLSPAKLRERAKAVVARNLRFLDAAASLRPAMALLGLEASEATRCLNAVSVATTLVSMMADKVAPESWEWLGAAYIPTNTFHRLFEQWDTLTREERELRSALPGYREERWPEPDRIGAAVAALRKTGLGKLFGAIRGERKVASEMLEQLGLSAFPLAADFLHQVANHVRSLEAFESSQEALTALGAAWSGMTTPFKDISIGMKLRAILESKLHELPDGEAVAARVVALNPVQLAELRSHAGAAAAFRSATREFGDLMSDDPLEEAAARCREDIEAFEKLLETEAIDRLSEFDLSISELAEIESAKRHLSHARTEIERSPFAPDMGRLAPDHEGVKKTAEAIAWARAVKSTRLPAPLWEGLLSADAAGWRTKLRDVAGDYRRIFSVFDKAVGDVRDFDISGMDAFESVRQLASHLDALIEQKDQLREFISLRSSRKELDDIGLADFLARMDEAQLPPLRLPAVFESTVAHLRAELARRAAAPLAHRTGNELDANRKTFSERDRQKIVSDREKVRSRLLAKEPPIGDRYGSRKTWTEMSLLANEFPKQKRFTPVRGLMRRAGEAIMTLKPCFMMSPLSLSKFLPAGSIEFDLLVIDEASQMRPEDALGAMLRAKQVVVVGDPEQLPPTSFFDRSGDSSADDDEEADEIDDESILERCQKVFREVRQLKWHYRSRCESLIRFSNDTFYRSSLVTFPAARPDSFSIDLVRVDGRYKARRNVVEAERVAEEAVGYMRHFAEVPDDDIPTLGIVALNTDQKDLIQETLRRMSSGDELVDLYREKAEKIGEPLFVKNLENVQGDERDYIFISMTYGKEPGASVMKQRFGPINSRQGHRRLNVLFSRARTRIGLFSSFDSVDVKPSEASREGVHVLKRYLEYAESKGRAIAQGQGGQPDSDFEIEVAERLRARGYSVETQVGVSGFRIDLGVRHPDRPGVFLAGIECDGAQYHSSKSARDRDRLREDVLRDKGWEILRVWSTDWFDNPDSQMEKLLRQLEGLRQRSLSEPQDYVLRPVQASHSTAMFTKEIEQPADIGIGDGDLAVERVNVPSEPAERTEEKESGVSLLNGEGPLSLPQARAALEALRDTVIAPTSPDWEVHRSILREAMIETFISQRITDPEDWFDRIPHYLRSGTNPTEKRLYLERICDVVARIDGGSGVSFPPGSTRSGASAGTHETQDTPRPSQGLSSNPVVSGGTGEPRSYRPADPTDGGMEAQRDRFYNADYLPMLRKMVAYVIDTEGPIYGDILAVRIARAHGIARTGGIVQRIISGAVEKRFPRYREDGRDVFWPEGAQVDRLVPFRFSPDGIRSYKDTPLAELASLASPYLRVGLADDQIVERMAEQFSLGRVRAAARERFEAAIALAKTSLRMG